MRRNPGAWLRARLLERAVDAGLLGAMGWAWLCGGGVAVFVVWWAPRVGPDWTWVVLLTAVLLPGAVLLLVALYRWRRGWRPRDMKKGAYAEEKIGQVIEYALTRGPCAVAHHVEEVARVGDIDHLVATPGGLWVIETKHGRVPRPEFRETLRRIAVNVEAVRDWAPPGTPVGGCLVFANEPKPPPKPTYESGTETIRCFGTPRALLRELRDGARVEGGSTDLARRVWRLGRIEEAMDDSASVRAAGGVP